LSHNQGLDSDTDKLTNKKILKTWLPLVASWMLMSMELPTINAISARLADPKINLAAYGGVTFPIALTIEAPVLMLLAASTAISRDWYSYQKLKKITLWMGVILSLVHVLVAVTPIYDFIVTVLLQAPQEVIEPARRGAAVLITMDDRDRVPAVPTGNDDPFWALENCRGDHNRPPGDRQRCFGYWVYSKNYSWGKLGRIGAGIGGQL